MTKPTSHPPIDLGVRDAILAASLAPASGRPSTSDDRVWRWLPWLLSFNGAKPTEILRAKGEDFLKTVSTGEKEVPVLRVTTLRPISSGLYPLHPGLLDMGLLDLAREYSDRRPFLPDGATSRAAENALDRYRRSLTDAGLLKALEGGLVMGFRKRLQNDLRTVGASAEVIDGLMGRRTEPSKFDDGSGFVIAGATALSRLMFPEFAPSVVVSTVV